MKTLFIVYLFDQLYYLVCIIIMFIYYLTLAFGQTSCPHSLEFLTLSFHLHACIYLSVIEELKATGKFELMDIRVDEAEHSMEMHLPYLAKVFEG